MKSHVEAFAVRVQNFFLQENDRDHGADDKSYDVNDSPCEGLMMSSSFFLGVLPERSGDEDEQDLENGFGKREKHVNEEETYHRMGEDVECGLQLNHDFGRLFKKKKKK